MLGLCRGCAGAVLERSWALILAGTLRKTVGTAARTGLSRRLERDRNRTAAGPQQDRQAMVFLNWFFKTRGFGHPKKLEIGGATQPGEGPRRSRVVLIQVLLIQVRSGFSL